MTNWPKKHRPELIDLIKTRDDTQEDLDCLVLKHQERKKARKALVEIQEKINKHIDKIIK